MPATGCPGDGRQHGRPGPPGFHALAPEVARDAGGRTAGSPGAGPHDRDEWADRNGVPRRAGTRLGRVAWRTPTMTADVERSAPPADPVPPATAPGAGGTPWTLGNLFRTYRGRILFTYALFNAENLVRLAQ